MSRVKPDDWKPWTPSSHTIGQKVSRDEAVTTPEQPESAQSSGETIPVWHEPVSGEEIAQTIGSYHQGLWEYYEIAHAAGIAEGRRLERERVLAMLDECEGDIDFLRFKLKAAQDEPAKEPT